MGSGSNTARDYVSVIVLFIFEVVIMLVYGFKG